MANLFKLYFVLISLIIISSCSLSLNSSSNENEFNLNNGLKAFIEETKIQNNTIELFFTYTNEKQVIISINHDTVLYDDPTLCEALYLEKINDSLISRSIQISKNDKIKLVLECINLESNNINSNISLSLLEIDTNKTIFSRGNISYSFN